MVLFTRTLDIGQYGCGTMISCIQSHSCHFVSNFQIKGRLKHANKWISYESIHILQVSSQFGAFHFGARQFGVFHFGAFPILVSMLIQCSRQFSFFSAKPSLARLAYLFVRMFPFSACFLRRNVVYEEVLSTPVCREATLLGLLWRAYHFLRIFPLFMRRIVCVIY